MSIKELDKLGIISKLEQKSLTQVQAAECMGISDRQVRRIFKNYKAQGAVGIISKKRGKPSNHQLPIGVKEQVLGLIQDQYPDFGPTLAHEKLVEVHKLNISIWTVRNIMIVNELWVDKKVKRKRIYQLRERRSREGELEQIDGSPHAWFEDRGPKCSLLHCVDDATGKIMAAFFAPTEAIWPYFELMKLYLNKHGRPIALYSDKHGVFRVNYPGALSGEGLTQFGRAMQELGIEMIYANSPQAKGRIERCNQTLQDRLVKELRLQKISTIEEANAYLPTFIEDFNKRFAVVPKDPNNAHKPIQADHNLDQIFSLREFRHLSKDLSFQYKNTIYQIQTDREEYALRKAKMVIYEKKDGSITALYKGQPLAFKSYKEQQKQGEEIDSKQINEAVDRVIQKAPRRAYNPCYNHPWKRGARKYLFGEPVAV
jgi:hypothetical protein